MSAETRQVGGDHYKTLGIQPMKFAMVNDWDAGAFSILKYLSRHERKEGKKDIEKALHFVELRVEQVGPNNRPVTSVLDRISIGQYIKANNFEGLTALALMYLEDWVYNGHKSTKEALKATLVRILDTY